MRSLTNHGGIAPALRGGATLVVMFAGLLMGASRCNPWGVRGGHHGGGHHPGGGSAGGGSEACGPVNCVNGQVCCNESCGICTEPGGSCTEQFCEPGPFCGGIAAIRCAGAGMCVDDWRDDCDPNNGGADCGGVCTCSGAAVLCIEGTVFNDDPAVCACEPAPAPEKVVCGGFLGTPCPGAGTCVDDPSDDCDPNNGGADCIGLCECSAAAVTCLAGVPFDDNPAVCACVE